MRFSQSTLIAGKSGAGKSYYAAHQLKKDTNFIVLLDKKNDHEKLAEQENLVKFKADEKLLDEATPQQIKTILEHLKDTGEKGVRIKPDKIATRYEELGSLVSQAILYLEDITLAVEELKNYAPDRTSREKIKPLLNVVSEGRSQNIRLLGTTQFPQQLHYMIYYNCNKYQVFYLGKRQRNYKKFTDNKQLIQEMKNSSIKDRKYIHINDNKGIEEIRDTKGIVL